MPPLDPALASMLAAYLQQGGGVGLAAGQNTAAGLSSLLQQLQGAQGGAGMQGAQGMGMMGQNLLNQDGVNPHSLSPTLGGYPFAAGGDAINGDFNAFLAQQQAHQAFGGASGAGVAGFSPAAASAFNAIPNLNSPTSTAAGNGAGNGAGATGANNGAAAGGQGASGATVAGGAAGKGAGSNSSSGSSSAPSGGLSGQMSMMSLKPFHDESAASVYDSVSGGNNGDAAEEHDGAGSFSSPSLLGSEARSPGSNANGGAFDGFNASSAGVGGGSIIGGGLGGSSTLSALFSSSLTGPTFLHDS